MSNVVDRRRADVLLAGAIERAGLAVARALSRRGISSVVLGRAAPDFVASSRHVRRYLPGADPNEDPDGFVETLANTCAEYDIRLVMPMQDAALALCSEHRGSLPEGTRLAAPGIDAVRNVLDKRENLETAARLGIPCPAEFVLQDLDQTDELVERLGFPMVLKNRGRAPGATRLAQDFKWLIAHDERELKALLRKHSGNGGFPLVQELVEGEVRNLCCFAASGKLIAVHEYRGLRRIGWEGHSVLREVTACTPQLVEHAERLLGDLGWDGAAQVAFIVRPDGAARYMETNGRFWGSVEGSIAIGWDFPYWTYRYFTQGELPMPPPVEVGSRTCWHFGDLRLLWKRLKGVEPPMSPRPAKFRALADYLTGFASGVHSDVFALDDPLPELVEHLAGVRLGLGRRLSRLRKA